MFDYAPAVLDPLLTDLGTKESGAASVPMPQVIKWERDARTISLIGSFLDMAVALSRKIIDEALAQEGLSQDTKDALQGVADLEQSKGMATLHLMSIASNMDANLKLL